jgi:branched-subunit amino acid transport protein
MTEYADLIGLTIAAGWATTYVWRFAGVYLAERLAPDSDLLMWVRAVATALVAALVARIIIAPPGLLAATPLEARLAAMAVGVAAFYLLRRRLGAGVAAAVLSLLAIGWLISG